MGDGASSPPARAVDSISVVIPTYRRPQLLERCLESLFTNDLSRVLEVILVVHDDDAEGLAEARRWRQRSPLVRLVYTKTASRGAARGAAAAVCGGDWCWFLDDDVMLPPDALRALAGAIASHPLAAVVGGPNRLPEDSGLFERCADQVLSSPLGAAAMRARYAGLGGEAWVDERSLIACNLAVRSSELRRSLPFHPWMDYGEETLFLARLRLEGCRFLHTPKVWVYHRRRSGWWSFCQQAFRSGLGRSRQTRLLPASLSAEFLGPPALAAMLAASPWLGWARVPLSAYAALCLLNAARAGWRGASLPVGLWTAVLVPSGHLAFGLGFWLSPLFRPARPGPGWASRLAGWVLRAQDVPVLRVIFAAYYRAALAALRVWLRLSGLPVGGLWLRRGLAGTDWTPGGSDVDLAAELPELTVEEELSWLDRWHGGLRRLHRLFPILGETQLATRREWQRYFADGDIRALELPREARPLRGRLPPAGRAAEDPAWLPARRALDVWSEALHAYVRLAGLACDGLAHDPRAAFNARKSLLDVCRYGSALDAPDWRPFTRPEAASRLVRDGSPLRDALAALEGSRPAARTRAAIADAFVLCALELESSALKVRERLPAGAEPIAAAAAGAAFPEKEKSARFEALCLRLEESCGGLLVGALHDSVNHWLLALRAACGPEDLRRAWQALSSLRGRETALSQVLLPLPPESLRLALWSPHLEDPLRALSVLGVRGCVSSGSTPLLRRHTLGAWKLSGAGITAPPRPLAESLLRESLAHVLVNWRSLDGPVRREDDYWRWAYLYGRALSLRLHADLGEAWPSFPLEPLARRFSAAYPEESGWLRDRVLAAGDVGDWRGHRAFFARQMRGSVRRMDELLAQQV
ncbi:MAG: glycosyltransferase [Elusimicrobia bacterium]|nr:glycosyltransferase [Elusimicrobiota bacterium]